MEYLNTKYIHTKIVKYKYKKKIRKKKRTLKKNVSRNNQITMQDIYLAPCDVIKMLIFCSMFIIAHTIQSITGRNVKFNNWCLPIIQLLYSI